MSDTSWALMIRVAKLQRRQCTDLTVLFCRGQEQEEWDLETCEEDIWVDEPKNLEPRVHWIHWLAEVPFPLQEDSSLPFPVKALSEAVALQDDVLSSSRSTFHHVLSTGQIIVSSLRRAQTGSPLLWEKIAYA